MPDLVVRTKRAPSRGLALGHGSDFASRWPILASEAEGYVGQVAAFDRSSHIQSKATIQSSAKIIRRFGSLAPPIIPGRAGAHPYRGVAANGPEAILQLIMEPGGTELTAAGKPGDYANESLVPAFLFDLDGTLVDSVYQHVLAWREALEKAGIELSVWRIHRRIGMSGGLFINALLRETGGKIDSEKADELRRLHTEAYNRQSKTVRPLPGARELLRHLAALKVPHAIATSGRLETAAPNLEMLGLAPGTPVVTRDVVRYAKPDPHLFLEAAAQLGAPITNSIVVGDSVWDMLAARRARALGVGLLSGGYGSDELERAGAYRVYQDPADLLAHLDEVGVRP